MTSGSNDSLRHRLDKGRACLEQLYPSSEGTRRAKVVAEGVQRLADYRKYLAALEGASGLCPGLQGQLGDRAFDAEATFRVMLAETVQTLNDLRDSGLLHAQLAGFAAALGGEEKSLAGTYPQMKEELSKTPIHLPDEFDQELHATFQHQDVYVRHDAESGVIVVRGKKAAGGAPVTTRIRLAPQVGDLGRIGLDQFFGANGSGGLSASQPIPTPPDCHHQLKRTEAEPSPTVDVYSALLGGLATARESMYRHARKVSEYGHGKAMVRAHDPVTVGVITAAIFVTVGVIAGFLYAFGNADIIPLGALIVSYGSFVIAGIILVLIWIFFL